MINSLLDLSRSQQQRLPVNPACVALEEPLSEACRSLVPAAQAKGITLTYSADGELPFVFADPGRVIQVLSNLIENAIKYTQSGGAVQVRAALCPKDPDFIRVSVTDNGRGISPDHAARVFERFYRVAETSDSNPSGLGLGLYICQELVKAHGGKLELHSIVGEGSTFSFTLPLFSLARLLVPILSPKTIARGRLGMISVQLPEMSNCLELNVDRYLASVHKILTHCTYESDDLILPRVHTKDLERRLCVVASTGEEGVHAMVRRIQEKLAESVELGPLCGQFEVSGEVLEFRALGSELLEQVSRTVAERIAQLVGMPILAGVAG